MNGISENCYNYYQCPQQNAQYCPGSKLHEITQYQCQQLMPYYPLYPTPNVNNYYLNPYNNICQLQQQQTYISHKTIATTTNLDTRTHLTNIMSFPSNNVLVDKYIAIKRIGTGTFGDIWKVMEKYDINNLNSPQKEYAIKIIKPKKKYKNVAEKQKYETMFLSEGKRIINLNKIKTNEIGRNFIIECKEILNCGASPCIVMELCGYSLLKYMSLYQARSATISYSTIRYITIQILSAMSFIHGVGNAIHSDLKPENILINYTDCKYDKSTKKINKYPRIKIVDFGNAITMNKKIKSFNIQTLWYRAPELLFGNKYDLSSLIDMWSIGCIIFELFSVSNPKHNRIFKCHNLDKVDVVYKIYNKLSTFPCYAYNKYKSYYFDNITTQLNNNSNNISHNEPNYMTLKSNRKYKLLRYIGIDCKDEEFLDFIDFLSCLLDVNPFTRYTSEDGIRHSFIINYEGRGRRSSSDNNYNNLIKKVHPIIRSSNDQQRQQRISKQVNEYLLAWKNDLISNGTDNKQLSPETVINRQLY